jgi:hypothetical protein
MAFRPYRVFFPGKALSVTVMSFRRFQYDLHALILDSLGQMLRNFECKLMF